jgi:hypothetical protein
MDANLLRSYAKADPFEPFTIVLSDGRRFGIASAENVWVPPSGLNCVVMHDDGTATLLDVAYIDSVSLQKAA